MYPGFSMHLCAFPRHGWFSLGYLFWHIYQIIYYMIVSYDMLVLILEFWHNIIYKGISINTDPLIVSSKFGVVLFGDYRHHPCQAYPLFVKKNRVVMTSQILMKIKMKMKMTYPLVWAILVLSPTSFPPCRFRSHLFHYDAWLLNRRPFETLIQYSHRNYAIASDKKCSKTWVWVPRQR